MVYIYVLELLDNKYYVGKTDNPQFRLESHFNSNGSAWTKKYKPINIIELIPNCDDYDEDKYTLKYMEKYGIDNVRGGSFVSINLDNNTIEFLNKMSNGTNNKCFNCGEIGHFIKDCKKTVISCYFCRKEFISVDLFESHTNTSCINNNIASINNSSSINNNKCYICSKIGHFAKDCKSFSVKKAKIPNINLNEKCDCATSYFSSHRRINCLLNKIITYFDDEDEIIDELLIDNNSSCIKTNIDNNINNLNNLNSEIFYCKYCNKEFDTLKGANCHENLYCKFKNHVQPKIKNDKCYRCGREGHFSNDCYATKHINGKYL